MYCSTFKYFVPHTTQGLWVALQPLVGLWVAPTFLHATTRPKQLFIDATEIDTTNPRYTRYIERFWSVSGACN